jgi:hypothetical protein
MLVNFIYNTIIEMAILVCILIWVLLACTIIIPLLWNLGMGDYFYIKDFIQNMRMNKIK